MWGWRISRIQLGIVLMTAGLAGIVAIPGVYATIASAARHHHAWWWPTWWMLAPALVFVAGTVLMVVERVEHSPSSAAIHFPSPPNAELDVILEREEFHPFQSMAIIAEVKITIQNRTNKTKHIGGVEWRIDGPFNAYTNSIDVMRERHAFEQRRTRLIGTLGPGDSISGWALANLPDQPWGGVGGFTLTIEDEIGTRYTLRRERRGGRDKAFN